MVCLRGDIGGMLNSSANGWSRGNGGGCGVSKFYLLYLFPFCLNNLLTFIGIFTRNSFISLSRPQSSPRPTLFWAGVRVGGCHSAGTSLYCNSGTPRSTLFFWQSPPLLDTRMRHSTDLPRFGRSSWDGSIRGSSILRLHHLYKNRLELG